MIQKSCQIKRDVVEEDPTEQGVRSLLNFGHTIGHAVEKSMGFSLFHGECVSLGMAAAVSISRKRGLLTEEEEHVIQRVLTIYNLPLKCSKASMEQILEAVTHDKKMDSGVLKFILLKDIGQAYIDRTVTKQELTEAIQEILEA